MTDEKQLPTNHVKWVPCRYGTACLQDVVGEGATVLAYAKLEENRNKFQRAATELENSTLFSTDVFSEASTTRSDELGIQGFVARG
jgi:hypothetical protein